jgi:NADPH-dependent 2,4-dienoyl-CoA reductase/sulfur reductase-like enzyme
MGHLVIVGGSDAGISAALRARELGPSVAVTVIVADAFPNYSICGLPFYLSGEVADWHALAHRTAAEIEERGITLLLDHTVQAVDVEAHRTVIHDANGQSRALAYDRLVIATGAGPQPAAIPGHDLPGVFVLHSMADSFRVHDFLTQRQPQRAIVVGGGYIGLEMADALTHRGLLVTLLQRGPSVLHTVESSLAHVLEVELRRHGVDVRTSSSLVGVTALEPRLRVWTGTDVWFDTDLVLLGTGVRPSTALAQSAGVTLGPHGAIQVTRRMETNLPDVYAAGDCVETWHRVLEAPTYLPLGTTAHKQGRVAGANTVGHDAIFAGSLGTQVVKVFDLAVARTGLLEHEALAAGFTPATNETTVWDHKAYYPGATPLTFRITGDAETGRLLGAQLIGHWQAEVAKRVDIFATALHHGMRVDELNELDLSYTPPVSSPWDPVQMAAQAWVAAH